MANQHTDIKMKARSYVNRFELRMKVSTEEKIDLFISELSDGDPKRYSFIWRGLSSTSSIGERDWCKAFL